MANGTEETKRKRRAIVVGEAIYMSGGCLYDRNSETTRIFMGGTVVAIYPDDASLLLSIDRIAFVIEGTEEAEGAISIIGLHAPYQRQIEISNYFFIPGAELRDMVKMKEPEQEDPIDEPSS